MRIKINDGYCEWEYELEFGETPAIADIIADVCNGLGGSTIRCRQTKTYKFNPLSPIGENLAKIKNKKWEYERLNK